MAAALAAGETPSPEMVAASGHKEAVSVRTVLSLFAIFIVGLVVLALHSEAHLLIRQVPMRKPPAVLEDQARAVLAAVGHATPPEDEATTVAYNGDFLRWVRAERRGHDRWAWLGTGRTPAVMFTYRASPRELQPYAVSPQPSLSDPPPIVSGMATVVLDTEGRLLQLAVVPPQLDTADEHSPGVPDWAPLFAAAGLDRGAFTEARPEWTPLQFADTRAAWTGRVPQLGDLPVRVEAAAYRGRPVQFSLVGPWTRPSRMEDPAGGSTRRIALAITAVLVMAVIVVAIVLSRNNLRTGRGDRAGAVRLALFALVMQMASWMLTAHHVSGAAAAIDRFLEATGMSLLSAAFIWGSYLALEPMVRKRWPTGLIGWTRLLSGSWRDPLVGRDVLVGLASGVTFSLLLRLASLVMDWVGLPPTTPQFGNPDALAGGVPVLVGLFAGQFTNTILTSLVLVLLMAVIRGLVRWGWLAFALLTVVFALLLSGELISGEMLSVEVTMALLVSAFVAGVAWRFGLLVVAAMLYFNQTTFQAPVVATFDTWYAPLTMTALIVLIGLAVGAALVARGGEAFFGRRMGEP